MGLLGFRPALESRPAPESRLSFLSGAHQRLPSRHHQLDRGEEKLPESRSHPELPAERVPQITQ